MCEDARGPFRSGEPLENFQDGWIVLGLRMLCSAYATVRMSRCSPGKSSPSLATTRAMKVRFGDLTYDASVPGQINRSHCQENAALFFSLRRSCRTAWPQLESDRGSPESGPLGTGKRQPPATR